MRAKNNVSCRLSSRLMAKILFCILLSFAPGVWGQSPEVAADQDEWSRLEQEMAQQKQALEVNEGELRFLDHPPEAASHFHHTRLLITEQSLRDGWVRMYQCHSDLDKVDASQIVYPKERISNIKVLSSQNIGSVRVEGHTVQMKGIASGSKICLSADRRALSSEQGKYHLKLGPFIRRFLDGYYPMHVRVEVCFPKTLQLMNSIPVSAMQHSDDDSRYADIDVWVVGELNIEFVFVDAQSN